MKHHETQTHSIPHRLAVAAGIAAVVLTTVFVSAGETPKAAQKDDAPLPKLVTKVNPVYPEAARKSRLEGIVVIETTIDAKGNLTSAKIAKGVEGEEGKALEDAALAAVKQWKFEPSQKKGKAVSVTYKVTVRFKLDK